MNGLELKRLREKLRLTQQEFGERLGLGYRAVQNYEKTGNIPEHVIKLIGYEFLDQRTVQEPEAPYNESGATGWKKMEVPYVHIMMYGEYLKNHREQAFIWNLPKYPFVVESGVAGTMYCAFEVAGDAMNDGSANSYPSGSVVLAREIPERQWSNSLFIWERDFVVVHKTDGIFVRRVVMPSEGELTLLPLNPSYEEARTNLKDVIQLFSVVKKVVDAV